MMIYNEASRLDSPGLYAVLTEPASAGVVDNGAGGSCSVTVLLLHAG